MRKLVFLSFLISIIQQIAYAAPQSLSYQGRILDASNSPLENSSVIFRFTLLSPDETCELWTEDKAPLNMTNSGGIFDLTIGPSAGLSTALENGTTHICLNSSPSYTGTATAGRQLKVEFNPDNTGWKLITPNLSVNSVPYASVAAKLGNMTAGDFIARPGTCSTGQSVYFDGTNFVCQSLVAGDIPNIDAAKITSGTLTTNVSSATGQFTNLRIYSGAGQYLTMNYPSVGAIDYAVNWPAAQGAASTVLQNDGAGNLSWAAVGSGSGTVTNVTSTDSYISVATGSSTPALTVNVGTTTNTVAAGDDARITGAVQTAAYNASLAPAALCTTAQAPYWNTITDQWACQNINFSSSGAFVDGGNTFGAAATLGTNDNFGLNFETNDSTVMSISNSGNVGIGTTNPSTALDIGAGNFKSGSMIISGTPRAFANPITIDGVTPQTFIYNDSTFNVFRLGTQNGGPTGMALMIGSQDVLALNAARLAPAAAYDNLISLGTNLERYKDIRTGTGDSRMDGRLAVGGVNPTSAFDLNGAMTMRSLAAPALSSADQGRIYFDETLDKFRVSQNGGVYVDLVTSASGDVSNGGNSFAGTMTLGTNDSQPLSLETGGTERVTILANGNVGIGTSTPLEKLVVNGAIQIGSSSGTNAGTVRWDGINFQGYNGSTWTNFIPQAPPATSCDTTQIFSIGGTYAYTVPATFGSITVRVWGAGGGSGGAPTGGATSGQAGSSSSILSLGLLAGGGGGGAFANNASNGAGGSSGVPSGGTINLSGQTGGNGAGAVSGIGGSSPNGGASRPGTSGNNSALNGNAPGGGAPGASNSNSSAYAGGGGGGAYVERTYTSATLIPGTYLSDIIVGSGGASGAGFNTGGSGAAGRVTIACVTAGSLPANDRGILFWNAGSQDSNSNFVYSAADNVGIGNPGPSYKLDVTGSIRTTQAILNSSAAPTISGCGTSPPAATTGSNNNSGQFTLGTGGTAGCTVTFANAFPANAFCTVTPASNYTGTYYISAQSNSAFTVTLGTGTDSVIFNYTCGGN